MPGLVPYFQPRQEPKVIQGPSQVTRWERVQLQAGGTNGIRKAQEFF